MSPKIFILFAFVLLFYSCKTELGKPLNYAEIKEEILPDGETTVGISDTADIFDSPNYDPRHDNVNALLDTLENIYEKDTAMIKKSGLANASILNKDATKDSTVSNKKDSFTADIKKITAEEIRALKYNLKQVHDADSILQTTHEVKRGRMDSRHGPAQSGCRGDDPRRRDV